MKKCERCGAEMPGVHHLRRFCAQCKAEMAREYDRKQRERKKAETGKPATVHKELQNDGKAANCVICGVEMVGIKGRRKYCEACGLEVRRERARKQKKQNAQKKEERVVVCAECGTEFVAVGKNAKYCDACTQTRSREKDRRYRQKKKMAQERKSGGELEADIRAIEKENDRRRAEGRDTLSYGRWRALQDAEKRR